MPSRILRENVCTSEALDLLSGEAERLYYRLLVQCDDFGRMDGRVSVIVSKCFPLKRSMSVSKITRCLDELTSAGILSAYTVDGMRYIEVADWTTHQHIRAAKSKYPPMLTDVCKREQIPPYSDSDSDSKTNSSSSSSLTREPQAEASASPSPNGDEPGIGMKKTPSRADGSSFPSPNGGEPGFGMMKTPSREDGSSFPSPNGGEPGSGMKKTPSREDGSSHPSPNGGEPGIGMKKTPSCADDSSSPSPNGAATGFWQRKMEEEYESNIKSPITDAEKKRLEALAETSGHDLVSLAITTAGEHGARSVKYVEQVVRDWAGKGVTTVEQAASTLAAWEDKRQKMARASPRSLLPGKEVAEHRYGQREYKDGDLDHLLLDIMTLDPNEFNRIKPKAVQA